MRANHKIMIGEKIRSSKKKISKNSTKIHSVRTCFFTKYYNAYLNTCIFDFLR
ncbi:hypothetical protein ERO13_D13G023150v2 [Gossypium hirsutum]|uniref:Uncharacterized protein n=4 Tax=Gossypium TaxID=3633 RepID=A0A5J5NIY3_GOSBA|nr:hypothetical protein ES319_D13G025900v1 [Gossypium barbadense]KAG4110016.1 hypothetical protein ERO13_D13G023150v2 [Gossypium hirsutum]TYG35973.1 hypothetical protein ES288_D13G027400v1 [Gossypium darwinii]TYH32958.1 hypothetical protein ES332_D13G026200v1 [Gossypium tomentosum]TYI45284.1 hypothetical protein E1A91_D13G026400v1 [Gossypium mustelinum]